jgi:uncharacterized protein (TIGR02246 family)
MELFMRRIIVAVAAIVVALVGPCQQVLADDTGLQDDLIAEVVDASKAIVSAFGSDDPDTYFKFFAPDATFTFYNAPSRLQDRAAYEREWASWRRDIGFKVRSCTSSAQHVQIFGEIAILTHLVQTETTTNTGDEKASERETIVFHRRDGRWLAVHEHLSLRP